MELSIKGVILRGRSKGMGSLYGLIRVIMKAISANNIHGKGVYFWNDGRKYEGQWK